MVGFDWLLALHSWELKQSLNMHKLDIRTHTPTKKENNYYNLLISFLTIKVDVVAVGNKVVEAGN